MVIILFRLVNRCRHRLRFERPDGPSGTVKESEFLISGLALEARRFHRRAWY